MEKQKNRNWKLMKDFIFRRFRESWEAPAYVLYFFTVIVLVGTFGVIKELFEMKWCFACDFDDLKVKNFCFNISSTGLALVTASIVELVFISMKSITNETEELKYSYEELENLKRSIRFLGLSGLIVSFVLWIFTNNVFENNWLKIISSILLLFFAYFIWWISNVRNKILRNSSGNIIKIIGGSTNDKIRETDVSEDSQNDDKPFSGDLSGLNS